MVSQKNGAVSFGRTQERAGLPDEVATDTLPERRPAPYFRTRLKEKWVPR